jgi:hypothetical protein
MSLSLYDKTSLVQIPSGYKGGSPNGTLYSVLPADGDGDFDHTRATSATRVNKDGLIESVASGVPRLDYPFIDGVVQGCPALLLEPSRTNYSIYSEDTSTWTYTEFGSGSAGTITTGKTDMFGGTNAVQIDFPANAENVSIQFGHTSSSISSGSAQTSLYIKLVGSATPDKIIQLRTGSDAENTTISGDSFVRYTKTHTKSSNEAFVIKLRPSEGTSSGGFSIIVCHPQEEAGSYATSYIPTSGSTVTRNADICENAGNADLFNDNEGVLFAEIAALANDSTYRAVSISDGTLDNRVSFYFRLESNRINFRVRTDISGTPTDSFNNTYDVSNLLEFNKIALKYKQSDFAVWINGIEVLTGTNGNIFSSGTLNRLSFDRADGGDDFYGKVKQLMTFNEALTDSELEQVTSWTSFSEMAKGQLYTIE